MATKQSTRQQQQRVLVSGAAAGSLGWFRQCCEQEDPSPPLLPGEAPLELCVQLWALRYKREMESVE